MLDFGKFVKTRGKPQMPLSQVQTHVHKLSKSAKHLTAFDTFPTKNGNLAKD